MMFLYNAYECGRPVAVVKILTSRLFAVNKRAVIWRPIRLAMLVNGVPVSVSARVHGFEAVGALFTRAVS